MEQRFATASLRGGAEVAYALAGTGPILVCPAGWLSHLELSWAMPPERRFYEALARGRTLLRYDPPGNGLSRDAAPAYSLDAQLEVLAAVMDAAGAERPDLLGISAGAPVAAAWAALHPDRVDHLVLYGGWVRGDDLAPRAVRDHVLGVIRSHWGLGSDVLADIFAPDVETRQRAAFAAYQREASPPETAAGYLQAAYDLDIGALLPTIKAQTLVLHRESDRAAPLSQAELLAGLVPAARLEILPGRSHLPYVGDSASVVRSIRRFLGLPLRRMPAGPGLTARQSQVASLVAEGLTNREIASRLGIDERSAEGHVERIRDRLGLRSRAQVAAWYAGSTIAN